MPDHDGDVPVLTPQALERVLSGDMPCVVCGYNLRGLSIRQSCPECGSLVRATILAIVDPHAQELQPLRVPKATAFGLVVWTLGALGAAFLSWVPHASDLISIFQGRITEHNAPSGLILAALAFSAVGALALVSPHPGLSRRQHVLSTIGVLAYLPLMWLVWRIDELSGGGAARYLHHWEPDAQRQVYRVAFAVNIVLIVLCLRPNARIFVARSLALRTGRVDRQTLMAVAISGAVMGLGDAVGLGVARSMGTTHAFGLGSMDLPKGLAIILIATGSALLTAGIAGSVVDCLRIRRAILTPGVSLRQVTSAPPVVPGEDSAA